MARCALLAGDWDLAGVYFFLVLSNQNNHLLIDHLNCVLTEQSAESVLQLDTNCVKAVFVMAEALYYKCSFEKAMVLYYKGMVRFYKKV